MQPSATASVPPPPPNPDGANNMDLQTMQSMDWLFKKERIYLLAQFWQQRATLAEKEAATLKEQLANSTTNLCETKEGLINNQTMDRQSYETEVAAKDKEINQLLEEVQRLQTTVTKLQESSINQISRLEEQLEQKRQHILRLENKLDQQRDYDELKRELSLLRPELPTNSDTKSLDLLLEQKTKNDTRVKTPNQETEGSANQSTASPTVPPTPTTPTPITTTLPHPFHTVETFGSMLGEEIVANWRRSLEKLTNRNQPLIAHTPPPDGTIVHNLNTSPLKPPTTPDVIIKSPCHHNQTSPIEPLLNGHPKSPQEDNNNHHTNNNNHLPTMALCGGGGSNNTTNTNAGPLDVLKSPYRFEEHRSPFRFAEDLGMAPGSMVSRLGESLIPKGDPMEAKLQEMLRYNMDKYATQNLDTLHIARRVRELLSIHNIGQRLFAKYILGLSQGTVSELLSKPKPWDKLTEKGRDSYRKMHAWACDEQAIMLLKSLIPKKDNFSSGKDTSGLPPYGRPENDLTEERIVHILNEANTQFQQSGKTEDSHSQDDSKSPHGQCFSPFSKDSSQNRRLKKYENDDIPQEKVVRIYQEELAKLMGRRMEDMRNPRDAFPGMFFPHLFAASGQMDRTQEEIRMALDAYHREIVKLNQTQNSGQIPNLGLIALQQQALAQLPTTPNGGGVQDLSLPKDKTKSMNGTDDGNDDGTRHSGSAFSLVRPKIEPGTQTSGGSTASSPLSNSILPPTSNEDFGGSAVASPLQRMASITNSLISQPPTQPHHTTTQRPLKAVLPPITQQQFDQYNNLNTEEIVKKVKEQLSQYSISQRLFGESVLGLSQGSVSDLLARPKPWHMLTQKGREPFIRMNMFLEDEKAVHKLVASQYKIAPEKLMRTGGYGGAGTSINKPLPPTKAMLSEAGLIKMQDSQNLLPPSLQLSTQSQNQSTTPMLLTPPGVTPHHAINLQTPEHLKKNVSPHGLTSLAQHPSMRSMHQHMSPSVYEMAALTQDLDTQVITTKIKEALLANNIGQKIFGEAVLGLSQGSVSELLSKPKPWHMLSIKGREPFIRMQLWLNDAHNVDRLQALKNERREANKRRRSSGPGAHDNSSDTSSNDTSEFYHSNSPGPGPPSAKKQRVLFSEEQKEALRLAFQLDPYPNVATIEFLATELNLSSRTITNWFHNHRMRLKQQVPHALADQRADQAGGGAANAQNGGPFDPVQFRMLLNQRLLELSRERIGLGGVPLPYPPYLAANTNLAALISRGLLPATELDLAALGAAKEELSGLDLSMGALKREPGDYDDDDVESNVGSEVSNVSSTEMKMERKEMSSSSTTTATTTTSTTPVMAVGERGRSSRRKPAAPQWVNPVWQDDKEKTGLPGAGAAPTTAATNASTDEEVIINGVCVMQTEDYGRRGQEETVRVEPTPVLDHRHRPQPPPYTMAVAAAAAPDDDDDDEDDGDRSDASSTDGATKSDVRRPDADDKIHDEKNDDDERWDY